MPGGAPKFDDAVRLLREGDVEQAEKIGRLLLAAAPRDPRILELLGIIARFRERPAGALPLFTEAIAQGGATVSLHLRRGETLRAIGGRDEEALAEFRTAASLAPNSADAHLQLGNGLKAMGRLSEARESLERATQLAPKEAATWLNLGVVHLELGKPEAAVAAFGQAVALEPGRAEAWNILGAALNKAGDLTGARDALGRALELRRDYAAAHNNLALVLKGQGRVADAVTEFRAALAIAPSAATHSNLLYALNFVPGVSADAIFAEHRDWDKAYAAPLRGEDAPTHDRTPTRRLNIGFVSPDLVDHAVAYFFEPYLQGRKREAVHVTCYSCAKVPDRVTERMRKESDRWRDVATLSDAQLAAQIRADGIDILVDLVGHTADNRLLVFARKPAPIQVTWLGYPNTTGLSAMNYRITDAIADPPRKTERWHSEQLVRLPDAFLCYRPPDASPPTDIARLKTDPVTFASFSNFAKLSDPCLEAWACLMERVADSRLILKSRGLGDPGAARRVFDVFTRHGIANERIELIGTLSGVAEHLTLYNRVDIALDPFPYNGTTTTCEALWMGVPVVTLAGETHVQRVGASLLHAVGHPEWVSTTVDEYIAQGKAMATEVEKIRASRYQRRQEMRRSSLCDAPGFAAKMDAALRKVWIDYCSDGTPVSVAVRPPNVPSRASATRLSLCMIVKNGAQTLPRCLDSVRGLADELIVVDTGSSDDSVEIARKYGAKIFSFPWIDDFSAARNRALEEATGAWILVLDADEALTVESVAKIRSVIGGPPNAAYGLVLASHGETGQTRAAEKVRLFPNRPTIRFEFPIHEQVNDNLSRAGVPIRDTAIEIDHVGYKDPATVRGKIARNRKIIEEALAKNPPLLLEQHLRYYRATAWCEDQRWDEAIADFERCLQIAMSPTSRFAQIVRLCLAECYFQRGELAKSCDALNGIGDLKTHPAAFALHAQIAMAKSQEPAVRQAYEALLAAPDVGRVPPVSLRPLKCRALQWLGEYWARHGRQDIGTAVLRIAIELAKNAQRSVGVEVEHAYRQVVPRS